MTQQKCRGKAKSLNRLLKLLAEMVIRGGEKKKRKRKAFDVQKLKFWNFKRMAPKGSSGHREYRMSRKRNESRQTGKRGPRVEAGGRGGEILGTNESLRRVPVPSKFLGQVWVRNDGCPGRFGKLRQEGACTSLSWGEPKRGPSMVWNMEILRQTLWGS